MKEYKMTDEEFQAIMDISKDKTPVIFVGVWLGLGKQERANKFWEEMGKKHSFEYMTVRPIDGKSSHYFTATEIVKPGFAPINPNDYDITQQE